MDVVNQNRIYHLLRYSYCLTLIFKIIQVIIAMFIIGIGSGFYLIANLGPGPRDGLMTGLQRKTKYSFTLIRKIGRAHV